MWDNISSSFTVNNGICQDKDMKASVKVLEVVSSGYRGSLYDCYVRLSLRQIPFTKTSGNYTSNTSTKSWSAAYLEAAATILNPEVLRVDYFQVQPKQIISLTAV